MRHVSKLQRGDLGLLPVRVGKRPVWKQIGADYSITFQDRDFKISGKINDDGALTASTKGSDNLFESKTGFAGGEFSDPKPSYNSRNMKVPFSWLTVGFDRFPRWAKEIKTQGLDLCNPLENPAKNSPWFPPS